MFSTKFCVETLKMKPGSPGKSSPAVTVENYVIPYSAFYTRWYYFGIHICKPVICKNANLLWWTIKPGYLITQINHNNLGQGIALIFTWSMFLFFTSSKQTEDIISTSCDFLRDIKFLTNVSDVSDVNVSIEVQCLCMHECSHNEYMWAKSRKCVVFLKLDGTEYSHDVNEIAWSSVRCISSDANFTGTKESHKLLVKNSVLCELAKPWYVVKKSDSSIRLSEEKYVVFLAIPEKRLIILMNK